MANEEMVLLELYNMYINNKYDAIQVIKNATNRFAETVYDIAVDIYRSCIKDYYSQYTPREYDRHGDISGFNLYRAGNSFSINNGVIEDELDASYLLKYKGKGDKKRKVLNSVINGFRGNIGVPGFPMIFDTRYPNEYSKMNYWQSSGNTIDEIFKDFDENVVDDLEYLFFDYLYDEM